MKIIELIKKSVLDKLGDVSSVRIQSYALLGSILTFMLVFIITVSYNLITAYKSGTAFTFTSEDIIILGMFMAHHLTLLGLKNNGEKGFTDVLSKKDVINQINHIKETQPTQPVENIPTGESGQINS